MPGDGLTLAVGVGREIYLIGFCRGMLYLLNHLAFLGVDDIARDKAALNINGVLIALR